MRLKFLLAGVPLILAAQQAPIGIVRGDLVTWKGSAGAGVVSLRTNDGQLYECAFDPKTYFERDNQRVAPAVMSTGDRVEIVSDRKPGSQSCYARTVHVMDPSAGSKASPSARARFRRSPSPTESFAPRGDLTFAGIIVRVDPDSMILRIRSGGEQVIVLRHDTRYIGEGQRVEAENLKLNTRVFVRAGRNLDNEIEAYQVVWGSIVQPN